MLSSNLQYAKIKVALVALEDCNLPKFTGSLLRGTLGHSLKAAFCVMQIGEYIRYLPYFVYSFDLMGKLGFGVDRNKFQSSFMENGYPIKKLSPEILLDSITRRYRVMNQFYGSYSESDSELGNLQISQLDKQKYQSWERYSNRQERKIEQGGLLGSYKIIVTEPKLATFLKSMEILHIGKNTTFGLGKIDLEYINDVT